MILVAIESPWAGLDAGPRALDYLRQCIRDSLARGEIPWASHAMFAHTRALYEEDPEQRAEGIMTAMHFIRKHAQLVAFYEDHGMSEGMKLAHREAIIHRKPIVRRKIYE